MLRTYRGKVNEDGTIRLQEEIDLPTGGEVLVTFLDKDALISLMISTGAARGYSEERLQEEMEEDEYWAHVYKDLLSS